MASATEAMIAPELLDLLCCPASHQPLREATAEELAVVNQSGTTNLAGASVRLPIPAGLVRQDGALLYPVWDDIPCLIASEAIQFSVGTAMREPRDN